MAAEVGQEVGREIGRRLRLARKHAGFTQTELAGRLGVSMSTVSSWERGDREPGFVSLLALARELGSAVGKFFPDTPAPPPDESADVRCARLERQLRTLRDDVYKACDELRQNGLLT